MSALVVRADKLESLVTAMDEIKASLPAGELAEIANINSVRSTNRFLFFVLVECSMLLELDHVTTLNADTVTNFLCNDKKTAVFNE